MSHHVRALLREGLIIEDVAQTAFYRRSLGEGTAIVVYGLTDRGLEALQAARQTPLTEGSAGAGAPVKGQPLHRALPPEPRVEVHNFEVKVAVQKLGISWLPSAAEMQNWTRRWDPDFHGVYLEVTTRHILLRAAAEAADRATAEALCLRRVMRVLDLLERHYGCELGRPEFRCVYAPGRTKIGVVGHPLTEGKGFERGELATIDSTPEPGTIHPHDPRDADRIVRMARNSEEAALLLRGLADQQTRFYANLNRLIEGLVAGRAPGPAPPDERREVV